MAKKHAVEHESSERWLLTYADLITLLLALFVVLWAFSQMDAKQVAEAMEAVLGEGEGGSAQVSILEGAGKTIDPSLARSMRQQKEVEALKEELQKSGLSDVIDIRSELGKLNFTLKGEASFESGTKTLTSNVKKALNLVLPTINEKIKSFSKLKISIEGHTDNIPISTGEFPSNLHLSTARALSTSDYLINTLNIEPRLIAVQGYGEYKPALPNTSSENRKKNRRVEISVITGETVKKTTEETE
ncbi:MAG: flagellar motor protein MotB [Ignavibacteriales bacterium]|nr:flagellar motor protein MotB [Ignavibacteriales bacterium]